MPISIDENNSSGVCSIAPRNDFFKSITARWIVPNDLSTDKNGSELISWIGLSQGTLSDPDGTIDADISVQIGIACQPANPVICTPYYFIFPYPDGPGDPYHGYMEFDNFPVSPGDTFTAFICNNLTSVTLIIINETTSNFLQPASIPIPDSMNFNPNWAGWIVGATNPPYPPGGSFAQYGAVIFDQNYAQSNTSGQIVPASKSFNLVDAGTNRELSIGQIEGTNAVCVYGGNS